MVNWKIVFPKSLLDALDLVISNNIFQFDDVYYRQRKAVAMGTKFAPVYATLTLGYLEEIQAKVLKPVNA